MGRALFFVGPSSSSETEALRARMKSDFGGKLGLSRKPMDRPELVLTDWADDTSFYIPSWDCEAASLRNAICAYEAGKLSPFVPCATSHLDKFSAVGTASRCAVLLCEGAHEDDKPVLLREFENLGQDFAPRSDQAMPVQRREGKWRDRLACFFAAIEPCASATAMRFACIRAPDVRETTDFRTQEVGETPVMLIITLPERKVASALLRGDGNAQIEGMRLFLREYEAKRAPLVDMEIDR